MLTKGDLLLLEEYKAATELTNHIDELRNKWTNFYLAFAGVAAAGIVFLLKEEFVADIFGDDDIVVTVLLFAIALLGVPVVGGLARLRRSQLRYYGIINSIRKHFLETDYTLWNAAQLSEQTLPKVRRTSGTYMWVLMVFFTSSALFALALYILSVRVWPIFYTGTVENRQNFAIVVAILGYLVTFILEDRLYFNWAKPRQPITYSPTNDPMNPKPNQPAAPMRPV